MTWLEHLARQTDDPFVLMAIADELPEQTLALRERAAEIPGRIVAAWRSVAVDADLRPLQAACR